MDNSSACQKSLSLRRGPAGGFRADHIRPYTGSWGKKQKAFPWGKVARR